MTALAALVAALVVAGCALTQTMLPPDAGTTCATSLTPAVFNSWFETGSVALNGAVKPANSVTFPDDPNCSFYRWSEQMFLWLTSPACILDLPVVLEKGTLRMLEILPPVLSPSGRQMVLDGSGQEVEIGSARFEGRHPVLLDPSGKAILSPRAILRSKTERTPRPFQKRLDRLEHFDRTELVQKIVIDKTFILLDPFGHFTEAEQGQADGGVLMAQNRSLVYYALIVDNVFALHRTMQGATVPAGTKFPVTQADLDAITAFAANHGQPPVIDPEALAVEIKTSWVEAEGLTDADTFIQMTAIVPTYDTLSIPNDWVPNKTKKTVKLAMVGMHVVGSTKGHPELLWATFEHVSNGPAAGYSDAKTPSGSGNGMVPQNTTGNWVFSSNGATGPFNQMRMAQGGLNGDHIVPVTPFTIGPSDILRTMPWGLSGSNATGNGEVISINNTVRSLLDPNDIRRNYFHAGTTWTIFGASPTASNHVGTNKLANTTMETFQQGSNCFLCHTTNTTAVSHVFDDTAPLF